MKRTIRILAALVCLLTALCVGFAVAESADAATNTPIPTPSPTPIPTPSDEDLGELAIVINGPDARMPMTVNYSEFTDGKYSLQDLTPGTYTVSEVDPDLLLTDLAYVYDENNSVQQLTIEVLPNATATNTLRNIYERTIEVTPTPTPVPSVTPEGSPEPGETPNPGDENKVQIPVEKVWDDSNNRDGNRPDRVVVKLYAGENKVGEAILTAATGWAYTFTDLPKFSANGAEIVYTVTEDPVALYTSTVDGYKIINTYTPVTTTATVSKVWLDNDNAAGLRPLSIYCTLSNGTNVELSAANNWTATVSGLPTTVNGQPVTYTWREQEAVGYAQTDVSTSGNDAVFTNSLVMRAETPPEGKTPPRKTRGESYIEIPEYGTPLGVDIPINHVGDCFD